MKEYILYKWSIKIVLLLIVSFAICTISIYGSIHIWNNTKKYKAILADISEKPIEQKIDNTGNPFDFINILSETALKYGCNVKAYTPYINKIEENLMLYTAEIIVSGNFIQIVKFIRDSEQLITDKSSVIRNRIASVSYRKTKDELYTMIVIQQLLIT